MALSTVFLDRHRRHLSVSSRLHQPLTSWKWERPTQRLKLYAFAIHP